MDETVKELTEAGYEALGIKVNVADNQEDLPMKGKRKPNGHQEKRGKQSFRRRIEDRDHDYPNYDQEFGHLEGDTIVGYQHKSAVLTLVERLTQCIIAIKPAGRRASDIETILNHWLNPLPKHLFKSIIFDCGKEFSNWKAISNQHDIDIYFILSQKTVSKKAK